MAIAVLEKGKPMDDLISRQAAIDAMLEAYEDLDAEWIIKRLPSAQKKGQWIYDSEAYPLGNPYGHYDCDQCGESVPHRTNYCPNCGADMRGESDG